MTVFKTGYQQNICYAQKYMAEQANCHWNLTLNYQVGDIVWLNTQNIHNSWHPVNKLNLKADEPF